MSLALFLTFLTFSVGMKVYKRANLPVFLDSLRDGRFHYFLFGLFLSVSLQSDEHLSALIEGLRYTLVGVGLVWFGFQTGLDFEIRRIRRYPGSDTISQFVQTLASLLIVAISVLAAEPLLISHLGLGGNIQMVALVLGTFATSLRIPELVFYRGRKAFAGHARLVNPACLILFAFIFPFIGEEAVIQLGPISFIGYTSIFTLLVVLGFLLGIVLDFVFHVHKEALKCAYLCLGVIAVVGGPSLQLQIPGLVIGFVGGAWLINTSVQRRNILELSESVGAAVEPIFFGLLGSLLAQHVVSPTFPFQETVIFAILFFMLRGSIKTLCLLMGRYISPMNRPWTDLTAMAWRPLGALSAAVLIQGLYVGIDFTNHALISGALITIFLTQALPVFVTRGNFQASRNHRSSS